MSTLEVERTADSIALCKSYDESLTQYTSMQACCLLSSVSVLLGATFYTLQGGQTAKDQQQSWLAGIHCLAQGQFNFPDACQPGRVSPGNLVEYTV